MILSIIAIAFGLLGLFCGVVGMVAFDDYKMGLLAMLNIGLIALNTWILLL